VSVEIMFESSTWMESR